MLAASPALPALPALAGPASAQPVAVDLSQAVEIDLSQAAVATAVPATFGEDDGGYFDRIGSVVARHDGLWATDLGHRTVFWFGYDGILRQRFGRAGDGPGELTTVSDIGWTPCVEGRVVVLAVGVAALDTAAVLDLGRRGRMVADSELNRVVERLRREQELPRSVEVSAASHWSLAAEIVLGADGEIWLRQATEDQTKLWLVANVFADHDQRAVGRDQRLVTLPRGFRLEAVWDGHMYGVVEDALGVQRIGVIAWRPGAPSLPNPA